MTRIVIIDDQAISRKLLAKLAGTLDDGTEAQVFADPLEALAWIEKCPPDLILTDYKMPHLDGVAFTRLVREMPHCTDVPVVMVTCIEDREIRYQALEAGATDFLTKPVDHLECRARCRNLLT
ncbi:MAG TPA: response regulator, partial [Alphaproteobacteria bacterium]|nr:response regulator [Alphaproteobacteria bacterium]